MTTDPEPRPRALGAHVRLYCDCLADPAAVWAALTRAERTASYLQGLAAYSTWEPGAPIEFRHPQHTFHGHVIHAEPPARLSYCLGDAPDDPVTYVTWDVILGPAGQCRVDLRVDEMSCDDTDPLDTEAELRLIWHEILSRFRALMTGQVSV